VVLRVDVDALLGTDSFEPSGWVHQDARLIGLRRVGLFPRYEIGYLLLVETAGFRTFDGRYLAIASFSDEAVAAAFYHDMQTQMSSISLQQAADFAEQQARTFGMPDQRRAAGTLEYEAYEYSRDLEIDPDARWVRARGGSPFVPPAGPAARMRVVARTWNDTEDQRAG
jgi:hypothetical protein